MDLIKERQNLKACVYFGMRYCFCYPDIKNKMKQENKNLVTRYSSLVTDRKGFTLIEIAMVLIIVGLLLSVGIALIGPLTKRAKLIETRETVRAAYEAILGYAAANKKLPDDLSVLGVKTTDAYTRSLKYFKATFTSNNLCTSTATYLTVNDSSSGTLQTKSNVAFIVFAEGEDRTNNTGTASPFAILEQGDTYDDIVLYADIDKLRSQICTSFKITTEILPIGTEEMAYPSTTLEATDGTPTYTWALASGSLPPGLSLSSAGAISGTPTSDGSYNFTVQVRDSDNPQRIATKSLAITINPNKPRITTEFLAYGTAGTPYPSTTLSATGGKPSYTWSLQSGSLPPGLSLSGGGIISGTPSTEGTYSFTVRVTDSGSPPRTHEKTLSIAINPSGGGGACPSLSLSPPSGTNWSATVGTTFSQSIAVSGGQTPYTNTQCTPSSCNGLGLNCTSSGATIVGTPTTSGTCTFNVAWRDSCTNPGPQTISGTYTVNISPPALPPTCTLSASPGFVPYNQTTTLSWSITNGPANGTFSPSSGTCTSFSNSTGGSCTTASLTAPPCTQTFQLTVTNANGSNTCSTTVYVGRIEYRVWNDTGIRDYMVDGTCRNNIANNAEITTTTLRLNVGETIMQYFQAGTCATPTGSTLTYNQAMSADSQGNCDGRVNFSGSDR
jgi:prepilin-type N-terminal cleavage/methylation domain-containing protein